MLNNLMHIFFVPEVTLTILAVACLMYGLFSKNNSLNKATNLAILSLLFVTVLIFFDFSTNFALFDSFFSNTQFTKFFKILTTLGAAISLIISKNYFIDSKINKFEIPTLLLFSTLGMLIMISSKNLMIMYLAIELQSLSLYVVASIKRNSIESAESGVKYFILGALSSGILLYGFSLVYGFTGHTSFEGITNSLVEIDNLPIGLIFGLVFVLVGLAFKVSAVPFHMWTPDVYEGSPTPVTAFFATVPKIAAVAVLLRVLFDCFGPLLESWQQVIILISVLSMLLGSIAAIGQDNIKRLMAYSSIGHIGFVLIGIASGTDKGLSAVLIYMVLYVIMNIGVFVFILNMERNGVAVTSINSLNMYNEVSKGQTLFLTILLFSLAGIPPLAGFFGKFLIFNAAINAGLSWLAIIGGISSVIAAFYYLRIVYLMYFGMVSDPLNGNMPTSHWLILSGSAILMLIGIINLYGLEGPSFLVAKSLLN